MSDQLLDELLTPRETARVLKVSVPTLAVWRSTRRYNLPWVRVGAAIRYRRVDVLKFIESRTQLPDASAA